jgi:hypothetical protein
LGTSCGIDRTELVAGLPVARFERLKRHEESGWNAQPDWTRRFIGGASRRMQSSSTDGVHHRPSSRCESGRPEETSTTAEGLRFGANRRSVSRHHRRTEAPGRNWGQGRRRSQRSKKIRGDPEILSGEAGGWISQGDLAGSSSGAGGRRCGATRTLVFGDTERTRYGATRKRSVGAAEGRTLRIASKVRRRQNAGTRRMR